VLRSWLPDLYFLAITSLPVVFTCANDYADMRGEVAVLKNVIAARFIVDPAPNPFPMAVTFGNEGKEEKDGKKEWYNGNCIWCKLSLSSHCWVFADSSGALRL
jgi:hypothetical protein